MSTNQTAEKKPVEQPVKVRAQFHVVINVGVPFGTGDLSFVSTGAGHNAPGGPVRSRVEGFMSFGRKGLAIVSGSGTVTDAEGDQVFAKVVEPDGSTIITGGTGKFAGASGRLGLPRNVGDPVAVYDAAAGTVTIDVTQTAEGTIIN